MKLFKRISALLTALLLALGAAALVACGEKETENPADSGSGSGSGTANTVEYRVTVQYEDGTPAEGVKVIFALKDTNEEKGSATTDAEGVAVAKLEGATYRVSFDRSTLPTGFLANPITMTAKLPKTTVKLFADEGGTGADEGDVLFTVTVLYPNGDPVVGAKIGMCKGTLCTSFTKATGDDGKTSQKLDAATSYTVQIVQGLPAGYTYDKDGDGHYMKDGQVVYVTDSDPNVTITLKAV